MSGRIRTLPSTNARIALTLTLIGFTGLLVVVSGMASVYVAIRTNGQVVLETWTPPEPWLIFLGVISGVDTAQFGLKRATHKDPPPEEPTA